MANPQPTDAHLRVAHSINEAIMLRDFTKRQRKILDLILRLSWGCGKKTAFIPRQRDFEVIGIRETHISTELAWLTTSKIIIIDGCEYTFIKDFDQWQVSRVKPYEPLKLTKLVSINLNGSKPKLTKTVSSNLPKQEVLTYQNSKLAKANSASSKESIKESIKEREDRDIKNIDNTVPKFAQRLGYGAGNLPTLKEAKHILKKPGLLKLNRQRLEELVKGYKEEYLKEKYETNKPTGLVEPVFIRGNEINKKEGKRQ